MDWLGVVSRFFILQLQQMLHGLGAKESFGAVHAMLHVLEYRGLLLTYTSCINELCQLPPCMIRAKPPSFIGMSFCIIRLHAVHI